MDMSVASYAGNGSQSLTMQLSSSASYAAGYALPNGFNCMIALQISRNIWRFDGMPGQ